jgi:hypothetical protein
MAGVPFDHWRYPPDYSESLAVPFRALLTNIISYPLLSVG